MSTRGAWFRLLLCAVFLGSSTVAITPAVGTDSSGHWLRIVSPRSEMMRVSLPSFRTTTAPMQGRLGRSFAGFALFRGASPVPSAMEIGLPGLGVGANWTAPVRQPASVAASTSYLLIVIADGSTDLRVPIVSDRNITISMNGPAPHAFARFVTAQFHGIRNSPYVHAGTNVASGGFDIIGAIVGTSGEAVLPFYTNSCFTVSSNCSSGTYGYNGTTAVPDPVRFVENRGRRHVMGWDASPAFLYPGSRAYAQTLATGVNESTRFFVFEVGSYSG